jgi:polysaccharide pyruvyl transferase WcaK-like protein
LTRPYFLIDASTYLINNNGDRAMLSVLLMRLRSRYPDAEIGVLTNDPDGVLALDPQAHPVLVGERRLWSFTQGLELRADPAVMLQLEDWLASTFTDQYSALLANVHPAAEKQQAWQQAVEKSSAIFLMGGGYFTDAFADHAVSLLKTLEAGIQRGIPTFIVGCGFEPVSDMHLKQLASAVLPQVTAITCRETLVSPQVLASFGVLPEQVTVTGDDAIEFAYALRSNEVGNRIGISLRDHTYNPIEAAQYAVLRRVIGSFAQAQGAALQPAPISNYAPNDMDAIRRVLPEGAAEAERGETLNTAEGLGREVAQCRTMIAGGYHAAVFALSMGIPTICLTRSSHYHHKMSGLLAMFGANPAERMIALDDPALESKLTQALQRAWESAPVERAALLAAAGRQAELGKAAYSHIFDRIDAARLQAAAEKQVKQDSVDSQPAPQTLALLELLAREIQQLRKERDYLQYHADERLKRLEQLKTNPAINIAVKAQTLYRKLLSRLR